MAAVTAAVAGTVGGAVVKGLGARKARKRAAAKAKAARRAINDLENNRQDPINPFGPKPMEDSRQMAAFGGIMGSDGRRAYGIGSFFKKAKRAVKKVLKSPIAKAALLAAGTFKLGGGKFSQIGSTGGSGFKFGNLPGAGFFKNSQNITTKTWPINCEIFIFD